MTPIVSVLQLVTAHFDMICSIITQVKSPKLHYYAEEKRSLTLMRDIGRYILVIMLSRPTMIKDLITLFYKKSIYFLVYIGKPVLNAVNKEASSDTPFVVKINHCSQANDLFLQTP